MNNSASSPSPSRTVQSVAPSQTVEIGNLAKSLAEEGRDIISLSVGEPDYPAPPQVLEYAQQAARDGKTKYTSSTGLPELRSGLSEKLHQQNNIPAGPDQLVVTCGAKHAVYLSLQALVDPGDDVLLGSPYWVSYPAMVRSLGATPVFIETSGEDEYKVSPDQLREAASERPGSVFLLNSPANPTGAVYSPDRIRALAEVVLEKDLMLVSDEIYEHFVFSDTSHLSPASIHEDLFERTATINGFSKAFGMTGLRVGYVAGPSWLITEVGKLQSHSTTHTSSLSQHAALGALEVGDELIESHRNQYRKRCQLVQDRLQNMAGVRLCSPEGSFYAFPDVSEHFQDDWRSAEEGASVIFSRTLLEETGVAVVPGVAFGNDRCIRISFGVPGERLQEAFDRLEEFLVG